MNSSRKAMFDSSGGVQGATSWLLRANNEIEDSTNARFNDTIGNIVRRAGFVAEGEVVSSGKKGLGLYESKFSNGSKIFSANNNSGDTATIIKSYTKGTGLWAALTMPTALPANMKISFQNSLDEMYIAGKVGTTWMKPVNVTKALATSETRNLLFAPKAKFITEFGGSLYAINVEVDGVAYPDRAYKSSPALGVVTYTRGRQFTNSTRSLNVDSARYLKPTMSIDIYNHITGVPRYTNLVIGTVDKQNDSITLPALTTIAFATGAVNTTTDVITLSSAATFPTGTPLVFTSTVTLPAPLQSDTTYYAINVSGTTIKVATTLANANAGTAIDLTTVGSGTHSIYNVYEVADNDEIWLNGRYGERCYLWNTDYPTAQDSDYLQLPSGAAANSEIVGYAKSNNRLFFYTDTSTHKWDRQTLITRFDTIGCASFETIANIGDWLIWLDSEGRVIGYNDSTGQQEFISKGIYKKYLKPLPLANLQAAAAGTVENMYKLCLGTVDGTILRVNYDFDGNTWAPDSYPRQMTQHVQSTMSGKRRLYFMGDNGQLYLDEESNTDAGAIIPFRVRYGKEMLDTDFTKELTRTRYIGQNMSGAVVRVFIDNKDDPVKLGQLTDNISDANVNAQHPARGRYFSEEIALSSEGSPIIIEGRIVFFSTVEDK